MNNAIKDVAHPPGQVINKIDAHQQLSDYIRSINRRDAFDQVAKEQKLTFGQWADTATDFDIEQVDNTYHGVIWDMLEKCWNAAQANK